jgi:ribosomal protein S11
MLQKNKNSNKIKKFSFYLIVLKSTINNLYISINTSEGKLLRVFSFAHINIKAVDHRKRNVFAFEFGAYFGKYLKKLNLLGNSLKIKIKGTDPRCFSFMEGFIKSGGSFTEIELISNTPYNGCRTAKCKRL